MKFSTTLLFSAVCSILFGQLDFTSDLKSNIHFEKMDSMINAGDFESITSILIAENSELVFENYYNDRDINSKHNTRSATKTIATYLTGIAIQNGFIDSEEDRVFKYFSPNLPVQNPDPRKDAITIQDLLTMSSCLECDDFNSFSRGHEERMYYIEDWSQFFIDLPIRAYPFNPPPAERPYGRAFAYCSAGAALLGDVIPQAANMKGDEMLKKYFLDPLDIKDYKLHYSPLGNLNTAGGSEYRSRDLLKMIQLVANEGVWNGEQIYPKDYAQRAVKTHAETYDSEYGYLLWKRTIGEYEVYHMSGNGGNQVMVIPDLDISLVITAVNYNNRNAHKYSRDIIHDFIIPAMESR